MRLAASLLALALPGLAFAAGSETATPPAKPDCPDGQVKDAQSDVCVDAQDSRLDDGERMRAVRAFAYAGDLGAANRVLDAMADGSADMVLTYRGFTARKAGDMATALQWYEAALAQNPDNLLARSYMGQGLAEAGLIEAARLQLTEIRARGGRNTWAEFALRETLRAGQGYAY